MDQVNNITDLWPPSFDQPPLLLPNISTANEELFNNDFILQCINKEKEKVNSNRQNDELHDTESSCSDSNHNNRNLQHPLTKRPRLSYLRRSMNKPLFLTGILRNNNIRQQQKYNNPVFVLSNSIEDRWNNITMQNNNKNFLNQDRWRGTLALPIDLSRENRQAFCSTINDTFRIKSHWSSQSIYNAPRNSRKVHFLQEKTTLHPHLDNTSKDTQSQLQYSNNKENENDVVPKRKRLPVNSSNILPAAKSSSKLLNDIKTNLHSRAERKLTRIATWNINNGFDHLAIASIMAKKDIDILALQEPRISYSTKDDVWISTMRKELRKCKYELITTQFSYLVFDEQTSGAALASILRQVNKVQGRLLSVTFKTDDLWEAHTVISIYAVTNPKSTKKYAKSRNSRKDVNTKLTKALDEELRYLQKTFGEAPITIVGDYQDTIHSDQRDNIGIIGKKMHPNGPLQMLLNLGFQSAYHKMQPNQQQVTRWNGSRTAGRHIDLQMLNDSAASSLINIIIDDTDIRNHITSDHLIVIADYNIAKVEQNIIDSYRTKINFRKIAGIKMKCNKKIIKCTLTSSEKSCYSIIFDDTQFMSCMVQDELTMLDKWQNEANSSTMIDILTSLEASMQQLEKDTLLEDKNFNNHYDSASSTVQRKLVERNLERRAHLDSIYKKFQAALYQIAASLKIISSENKHIEALCTRQLMKTEKTKRYGENIINLNAPTSKLRSALGDLKNAEATLRNLHHRDTDTAKHHDDLNLQRSFKSLSKNIASFKNFTDALSQITKGHEENLENENAVSKHRMLDSFSGRWNECKFSSDICKSLLFQTNKILKENNVKQYVGVKQFDQSSTDDDQWTNLQHWWNGPDLVNLANSPDIDINNPVIADAIQNALEKTRKLKKKAMAALISNKEKILIHDSRMNHTKNISQRLNPKVMDEPEAHHVILNQDNIHATSNIRCKDFQQCLDNTLLYHQNWMDRSGSKWEHFWFKTTSKFGHIDGITFNFAGKPSDIDFKCLVKQHENCSDTIKKAFQDAHSDEIASVMHPPRLPYRALDWIWHPSSDDAEWNTFVDNYWKAISAVPGKARYNGYTMAVIGRLPCRWIDLHLRIMKMMMILRILPEQTKIQARVPIPKPKPGETRPLSLIHDDMCFILGFITKHFTLKCEEIKLFPPTIRAYRQGMSTSFITLVDLAMREDAVSFGRYMALTSEDEEKFFDRVSLEVQLAVLFILGFPSEGFLEMKSEEMDNISVEIHTRHGQIIGKFLHGLKQGSPLSCLISNLVLIFKHRVWSLRDPLSKADDPNGYSMTIWNKSIDGDASPLISMAGFCDDNSKWNMGNGQDFASLIQAIKWNVKMAGDLSMIFKIGRRGDKTIIELFNVDLKDIHLLPEHGFTSIAWDFKANRPTEEEVDCRVYLKSGLSLPSTKPDSLSESVWNMLVKGISLKSERSLGIWRNKLGDTSESADKRAFLFGAKIDRLNLSSLKHDKTIKIAINSLVVPVYQFGILENKCCPQVYDKMDVVLINKVRQAIGFAWCDAKQLMFVSEDKFGMGIRSVSVEMLKSICRELEIQLNDEELIGKILRGRLEAFKDASFQHAGKTSITSYDDINQGIRNYIMEAIRHIAHYGFYLRDMTEIKVTYQIESLIILTQNGTLLKNFQHHTLGMNDFAGTGSRSGTTLGPGDTKLLWSSIYGRGHTLINGRANYSNVKQNFSLEQIQDIKTKAIHLLQDDIQALYTFFEWSDSNLRQSCSRFMSTEVIISEYQRSINNKSNWHRISALSCLKNSGIEDVVTDAEHFSFMEGLLYLDRKELLTKIDSQYIQPNRLLISDIEFLLIDGWPLIIATDGGADKFESNSRHSIHQSRASASVVIFHPPSLPFAQYINATEEEQTNILSQNLFPCQNLFPWKARASSIPKKICDHLTDNAHAECFAIILMEEWLPQNIPVLLIMDSEAERSRYHNLRNMHHTTNRFLLRSLMSGVSKCLANRLSNAISKHQVADNNLPLFFTSNIAAFCLHAKSWCYNISGEQSLWKIDQWQPGQLRTVWAIRSHQLESNFTISPKNRYGTQLVPNRAFVSTNQWVDNVCNAIMRFKRNAIVSQEALEMRKWCSPDVALGLTGPNFIITFNGYCLDRCVSTAVEDACNKEFIRRLAQRPTQGLLIRLQNDLYIKPEMIGRQGYHRRFLEGKTKTHTRAMYTDLEYRKAIIYTYAKNEKWEDNNEKFRHVLKEATTMYKYLRCPFCVPIFTQHDRHIFHHHASETSGLFGNSRHFCFYCLNEQITAVRQQMTQMLEDNLTDLFRIASKWGRNGFSTLLERAINALIMLDRSSFHNAHSKNPNYVKLHKSSYACLSAEDWLSSFESQSNHMEIYAKKLFYQWPLVHQLGFIPANCYSLLEMQDGEYSPCDLIPLGIIPLVLQDVILQFATELGARHSSEAKKEFLLQWKQVRAVAILRAISIAMVTGAQVSEYKSKLLDELPSSLFEDHSKVLLTDDAKKIKATPIQASRKPQKPIIVDISDRFSCEGITCSLLFTTKTNLRSSLMRKKGDLCRRCQNMNKAIDCSKAIESTLAEDLDSFRSFHNSLSILDIIKVDDIIAAISKLDPLPDSILPAYLKRATKRNVYPTAIMNTARLLKGTFNWNISGNSTSIDTIFNHLSKPIDISVNQKTCQCKKEQMFFAIDNSVSCPVCAGRSPFTSTKIRIILAQASVEKASNFLDRLSVDSKKSKSSKITLKHCKHRHSGDYSNNNHALIDITNLPSRPPLCLAARPTDIEICGITRPNNMLSNFVITYFFKLLATKFKTILYQEFLFDFVKREGGWKNFLQYSRKEGNYTHFFEQLSNQTLICIVPICCHAHWTLLVRRFFGNSWKIFFLDSILQGSDQRFQDWKALFSDDDLFSGEWIKVKNFQQSELECGARVCLHGVCFTLSQKKCGDIINDLSRFKDLSTRSRLMVSHICKDGFWSYPKWLSRTIGAEDSLID